MQGVLVEEEKEREEGGTMFHVHVVAMKKQRTARLQSRLPLLALGFFFLLGRPCSTSFQTLPGPAAVPSSQQHPPPELTLSNGTVLSGLRTVLPSGRAVLKFLGIRYGRAMRFKSAESVELPVGRAVAQTFGPRCPQGSSLHGAMSEDCLYLNVFVPESVLLNTERPPLPVLVWIHGGGFIVGASNEYEAEELAGDGNILVVTINYRLGPLGFLATGDASAPGNYGLNDQRLALRWVQTHIADFGGDKGRVTLGGVSAGAASASLHALSFRSRGLFSHVIQMSGAATSAWARISSAAAAENARALGVKVGCPVSDSTQSLVNCLATRPLDTIMQASVVLYPHQVGRSVLDFTWVPVEDGPQGVGVEVEEEREGEHASPRLTTPVMAGLVGNEGDTLFFWTVPRVSSDIPNAQALLKDRHFFSSHFLPALLKQSYPDLVPLPWTSVGGGQNNNNSNNWSVDHDHDHDHPHIQQALHTLQCAYGDRGETDEGEQREKGEGGSQMPADALRDAYADQGFLQGTAGFLQRFCSSGSGSGDGDDEGDGGGGGGDNCYLYYADYQTSRPDIKGLRHVDDVAFLFGFNTTLSRLVSGFEGHVTDLDLRLARDMRSYFLNFIATGNPNTPEAPLSSPSSLSSSSSSLKWPGEWPTFTPSKGGNGSYLHVSPSPAVLSRLNGDEMALWWHELPRILRGESAPDSETAFHSKYTKCLGSSSSSSSSPSSSSGQLQCVLVLLLFVIWNNVHSLTLQ